MLMICPKSKHCRNKHKRLNSQNRIHNRCDIHEKKDLCSIKNILYNGKKSDGSNWCPPCIPHKQKEKIMYKPTDKTFTISDLIRISPASPEEKSRFNKKMVNLGYGLYLAIEFDDYMPIANNHKCFIDWLIDEGIIEKKIDDKWNPKTGNWVKINRSQSFKLTPGTMVNRKWQGRDSVNEITKALYHKDWIKDETKLAIDIRRKSTWATTGYYDTHCYIGDLFNAEVWILKTPESKEIFYKKGDRFSQAGEEFLLAAIGQNRMLMIAANGNHWGDGAEVDDSFNITEKEFDKIVGTFERELWQKLLDEPEWEVPVSRTTPLANAVKKVLEHILDKGSFTSPHHVGQWVKDKVDLWVNHK